MNSPSPLDAQITEARRSISADGYPMSIGELTNLYRDGELLIRPEFQRLFRWSDLQKSRLIESILLGIPLPSIFVAQTEDGKWEVVDGLQRLSTILHLQGELRDANGDKLDAFVLEGTDYLPSLQGRLWQTSNADTSLSEAQRLDIKRAKIDLKIIKRDSSPQAKYDLFHRLNNYGTPLTPQELRSSLLVAVSPTFFRQMESLAARTSFRECVSLSERLLEERFDLELVSRFLVLHNWSGRLSLTELRDLPKVLDTEIVKIASLPKAQIDNIMRVFNETFDMISNNGGEDVFRRWDPQRRYFTGSFLLSAYEVFGLGVGYRVANELPIHSDLIGAVKDFWVRPDMAPGFVTGRSTEARLVQLIPLGRAVTGP